MPRFGDILTISINKAMQSCLRMTLYYDVVCNKILIIMIMAISFTMPSYSKCKFGLLKVNYKFVALITYTWNFMYV